MELSPILGQRSKNKIVSFYNVLGKNNNVSSRITREAPPTEESSDSEENSRTLAGNLK